MGAIWKKLLILAKDLMTGIVPGQVSCEKEQVADRHFVVLTLHPPEYW